MTIGNSGEPPSNQPMVVNRNQLGTFSYAQNIYNAWLQIKADEKEMIVQARGIDLIDGQVKDLYMLSINRGMRMNTWIILVIAVFIVISVLSCCIFYCLNRRQHLVNKKKNRERNQEKEEKMIELNASF